MTTEGNFPIPVLAAIILGFFGLVAVAALLRSRKHTPHPPAISQPPPSVPVSNPSSYNLQETVLDLLNQGRKIEAIKQVRGATGWGLKESKDYVEALEQGHPPPSPPEPVAYDRQQPGAQVDLEREVADHVQSSGKIAAIKRVREITGWGLKESKDYVEALEQGHPPPSVPTAALYDAQQPRARMDLELETLSHLQRNGKIAAIKRVREITGWGLKQSKSYVDQLEQEKGLGL